MSPGGDWDRVQSIFRIRRAINTLRKTLRKLLAHRWELMARDVEEVKTSHRNATSVEVFCGDGRVPATAGVAEATIDLIITSPPYPNNIDYNEVYKLELWLLGFATTADGFLDLRRQTFRSHPTCRPIDAEPGFLDGLKKLVEIGLLAVLLGVLSRRISSRAKKGFRGGSKLFLGT